MNMNYLHNTNRTMSQRQYQEDPAELPMISPKEQTMMWQQNSYLVDSGIHSGAATQVPSITGGKEEEEMDLFDLDQGYPQFSQDQIGELNQTHSSHTMYPEIMDKEADLPCAQYEQHQLNSATCIPNQAQKRNVASLFNYQDEADIATKVIPKLISLLNDEDQVVVSQAAIIVQQLSKKESSLHAIMNSLEMITSLVCAISNSNDFETIKSAVAVLHKISHHRQGLMVILKSGGIPMLVQLLSFGVESVLFYSITTLHNLLLHQEGAKVAVRVAGGLQKMVSLLQKDNVKFLTIVTDCLQILAYGNQESKMVIFASQGHIELVRIMQNYDYEKLLWTTARVLKVLSVCPSNKPAIVEAGGMQALGKHLLSSSQRLVHNCLWTLRNLSDAATKMMGLDELLLWLIEVLNSKDIQAVTCASGILSNLTCNNESNKVTVYQIGGVGALMCTLVIAEGREEIVEPIICTLRHLTSKNKESDGVRHDIMKNCGLQTILKCLNPPCSWALIKATIGLIRNLALRADNYAPLREMGAVNHLVQLLNRAYQTGQKTAGNQEGKCMEEIVEGTVSTLQILAREPSTRLLLRQQMVIPTFIQLLYHHNKESIQRSAAGILYEIASDREGAQMIDQEGGTVPLTNLMHSLNDDISSYAAEILCKIGEAKTQIYEKQHSMQINPPSMREENIWNSDLGMVQLQDILSSDDPYDSMYSQGPSSVQSNHNSRHFEQGYNQIPVDMEDVNIDPHRSGNESPYSLFDAMDVSMINTESNLNFNSFNQIPTSPQDNSVWFGANNL